MLIRFNVKNFMSFKEEVEFSCLPGKATRLGYHKIEKEGIEVLKLGAIYGANASGKSNLIKSIQVLKTLILEGELNDLLEGKKFKLSDKNLREPIEFSIEFMANSLLFYYEIAVDSNIVNYEYFQCQKENKEVFSFTRKLIDNRIKIIFSGNDVSMQNNLTLIDVIEKNLLQPQQLLLTFLSKLKENDFSMFVETAINWIDLGLVIIFPFTKTNMLVQKLDENSDLKHFTDNLIKTLSSGIIKTRIEKINIQEIDSSLFSPEYQKDFDTLSKDPDKIIRRPLENSSDEIILKNEGGVVYEKRLLFESQNDEGKDVSFKFNEQSDGTKRLIEYIPAWYSLQKFESTFIIDEIERSIHPLLIRELISKFSFSEDSKGQLIFSTHETLLLDQDFFRTDEIWLTEKDISGVSRIYSLAEFKEHNTIDIRKGYLNGRYGGVPFLGDLDSFNWRLLDES